MSTATDFEEEITLPSGIRVSLRRPDFSLCRTQEDLLELRCALMEKIIDIELQIDMFKTGAGATAGRPYAIDWLPRASAALKWAKLYRDECQQRQGMLKTKTKISKNNATAQRFVDLAREILPRDDFQRLMGIALGMCEESELRPEETRPVL